MGEMVLLMPETSARRGDGQGTKEMGGKRSLGRENTSFPEAQAPGLGELGERFISDIAFLR